MVLASHTFEVADYDLAGTLNSGQSFRWNATPDGGWEAVVAGRWVSLHQTVGGIRCTAIAPVTDWTWLADYLQVNADLGAIVASFPKDKPMRQAERACRGLRLLRQDPWECLASFILSSTKQIVQIRQVVAALTKCFGAPVPVPGGRPPAYAFPTPEALAGLSEQELRKCKMGFRAPYIKAAAQAVKDKALQLDEIPNMPLEAAREELMTIPGVGPKIANCVLLFAYGYQSAFPLDVWILKALRQLYFPGQKRSMKQLVAFSEKHFGSHSGYAQQYLFQAVRTGKLALPGNDSVGRGVAKRRKNK
jgi:N-glycosylase/DNA lyase